MLLQSIDELKDSLQYITHDLSWFYETAVAYCDLIREMETVHQHGASKGSIVARRRDSKSKEDHQANNITTKPPQGKMLSLFSPIDGEEGDLLPKGLATTTTTIIPSNITAGAFSMEDIYNPHHNNMIWLNLIEGAHFLEDILDENMETKVNYLVSECNHNIDDVKRFFAIIQMKIHEAYKIALSLKDKYEFIDSYGVISGNNQDLNDVDPSRHSLIPSSNNPSKLASDIRQLRQTLYGNKYQDQTALESTIDVSDPINIRRKQLLFEDEANPYGIAQLRRIGYRDEDILASNTIHLKYFWAYDIEISLLRRFGYTDINKLRKVGYTCRQLFKGGFSVNKLKDIGYTAKDLYAAGASINHLKLALYTEWEIIIAGYPVNILREAGYNVAILIKYYLTKIYNGEINIYDNFDEEFHEDVNMNSLKKLNSMENNFGNKIHESEMKEIQSNKIEKSKKSKQNKITNSKPKTRDILKYLINLGFTISELRENGFTIQQFHKAIGRIYDIQTLLQAGFSMKELLVAGYDLSQLISICNLSFEELLSIGIDDEILFNHGFIMETERDILIDFFHQTQESSHQIKPNKSKPWQSLKEIHSVPGTSIPNHNVTPFDDKNDLESMPITWKYSDNWNSSLPLSSWTGIKTELDEQINLPRIIEIDLSNNNLHGKLPSRLFHCKKLRVLKLNGNSFLSGEISEEVLALSDIELIDITNCNRLHVSDRVAKGLGLKLRGYLGQSNDLAASADPSKESKESKAINESSNSPDLTLHPSSPIVPSNESKDIVAVDSNKEKPSQSVESIDNSSSQPKNGSNLHSLDQSSVDAIPIKNNDEKTSMPSNHLVLSESTLNPIIADNKSLEDKENIQMIAKNEIDDDDKILTPTKTNKSKLSASNALASLFANRSGISPKPSDIHKELLKSGEKTNEISDSKSISMESSQSKPKVAASHALSALFAGRTATPKPSTASEANFTAPTPLTPIPAIDSKISEDVKPSHRSSEKIEASEALMNLFAKKSTPRSVLSSPQRDETRSMTDSSPMQPSSSRQFVEESKISSENVSEAFPSPLTSRKDPTDPQSSLNQAMSYKDLETSHSSPYNDQSKPPLTPSKPSVADNSNQKVSLMSPMQDGRPVSLLSMISRSSPSSLMPHSMPTKSPQSISSSTNRSKMMNRNPSKAISSAESSSKTVIAPPTVASKMTISAAAKTTSNRMVSSPHDIALSLKSSGKSKGRSLSRSNGRKSSNKESVESVAPTGIANKEKHVRESIDSTKITTENKNVSRLDLVEDLEYDALMVSDLIG